MVDQQFSSSQTLINMENIFRLSISIEPNTALDKLKKKKIMIKGLAVAEATGQQRLGTLVGGGGGVVGWQIVGIGGWRFS